MSTDVEKVKDRLNIVDVVGQYVKLHKAGKNWKGLSPFKKEKTPSFYVSPDKGMYYDFSSGQGGDIFTFIEKMEGVDFQGALHILAERAGVELSRGAPSESKDVRERRYDLMEETCRLFEQSLTSDVRIYLTERGLTEESIKRWRIGFAPPVEEGVAASWTRARDHLLARGYSDGEIEESGITKKSERGTHYDRFRSRIMFPISDSAGRVIAFSGRSFGRVAADKDTAKYLNSPETPLFDKSRVLYGYDRARQAMRAHGFAIVVEGQMDLLMAHQAGYVNTVAASGTGLTHEHFSLVARLTKRLVLALDPDEAGMRALHRASLLALPMGFDLKAALLPEGKDPADCIRENVEEWKRAVREAVHVMDFFLRRAGEGAGDERMRLLRAQESVLPLIASMENHIDRTHCVNRFAHRFAIAPEAVREELAKVTRELHRQEFGHNRTSPQPETPQQAVTQHKTAPNRREALGKFLAGARAFLAEDNHGEGNKMQESRLEELADTFPQFSPEEVLRAKTEAGYTLEEMEAAHLMRLCDEYEVLVLRERLEGLTRNARAAEMDGKEARAGELLREAEVCSRRLAALEYVGEK